MHALEPHPIATPRHPWLREPLLHFVLLGALLFAADHFLVARSGNPNVIVVSKDVTDEAKSSFRTARGREPNAQELEALTRRWVDNEILFREGITQRVDQGDKMIRDRVIFKALMMVESGLKLPPADDDTLRQWFEANRAKYDDPARYDFQEAVLAADNSEAAARAFARPSMPVRRATRRPGCASSRRAPPPVWNRVMAPSSSRRLPARRWANGGPCPHATGCA